MTRRLVDVKRPRGSWVLACDREGCRTTSPEHPEQPALKPYADSGWYIASLWGDRCPTCVAAGLFPLTVDRMRFVVDVKEAS